MDYRLLRTDGEYRWLVANGIPLFKPDGVFEGYIGSCIDITELKRSQEENLDRQKLEGIGLLAAGIAHDFNNLLGGILAEAELIEAGISAESDASKEIQKVKDMAIRGSEIVRELMVYAGSETTTFVPVDLSCWVREMLELLKISISKRVILRTDLGKNLPVIMGQTSQIRQLVMNLVTNARSDRRSGRRITVTTSLATAKKDWPRSHTTDLPPADYVRLDVSDTGGGMTKEEESKIFDPFYTTKFAGGGLGLAVVQGVVRAH
jgi:signal transduction histidine kinase